MSKNNLKVLIEGSFKISFDFFDSVKLSFEIF
jgi:hypothetical protein